MTSRNQLVIPRPQPGEYAEFYAAYVALVPEGNLLERLESQIGETLELLGKLSEEESQYRYADGKWSIKEVVGHLADVERVFCYRALRFARGDRTPLPGFDENLYVPAAEFDRISMPDLLEDFRVVRSGTLHLFSSMKQEWLERSGPANGRPISVRAIGYIIGGHEIHHQRLLTTRYGLLHEE